MVTQTVTVKRVVTETVAIPEGYIRFSDALRKYGMSKDTLWRWVKAGYVHQRTISHKQRYVCEADIRGKLGLD